MKTFSVHIVFHTIYLVTLMDDKESDTFRW